MSRRNYGVDLLRIVSMYMIVLNHVLLKGGVIEQATKIGIGTLNYDLSWILDIICYAAVNCYALISGYVGVKAKFKPVNIIKLWLQVLFYSVMLNIVVAGVVPRAELSKSEMIQMFFPVSYQRYWYFSAYFVLFFFMPFLNYLLKNLDKNMLQKLILGSIVFFSIGETFIFRVKEFLALQSGYSFLWLMVLYLIGGYIKLYDWNLWKHDRLIFIEMAVLSFVVLLLLGGEEGHGRLLINYPAPTMLFMAIALLNYFKDLRLQPSQIKWVKVFAPLTFGVYLIHLQPMVAVYILQGRLATLAFESPWLLVVDVIFVSFMIYLCCSVIEWGRQKLFYLMEVETLAEKLNNILLKLIYASKKL